MQKQAEEAVISDANIIRQRIDNGPFSAVMIFVVFIGFLLNLVDGFDVVAMSVAAPSLIKEWGVTKAELGPIFSSALFGMAIGAAVLAPYADKFGRRLMIIMSTALIGLSMIVIAYIPHSVPLLVFIRFITGLGIGIIFASGATIASEFAPERYRNLAVTLAIMGYATGAMVVGPVANVIIPLQGWEMLFLYGGIVTLILGLFITLFLPESVEFLASKKDRLEADIDKINTIFKRIKRHPISALPVRPETDEMKAATVNSLLTPTLRRSTLSLWTIYFMGFLTVYFLLSWIPTLFIDSGYSRAEGIAALTYFNLGAVIGILIIGMVATKIKLAKPIALYFLGAALALTMVYVLKPESLTMLNATIFIIGFFLQGAFTAVYALAARVYPAAVRATGIGWGAGLGRVGAIVSPILTGLLVASGWGLYTLFLLFAAPLVIAALLVVRYRV